MYNLRPNIVERITVNEQLPSTELIHETKPYLMESVALHDIRVFVYVLL